MNDQEEQLEREVTLAQQGKAILNNPAFKQALVIRKAQIFDVFCNTKKDQEDVREEAWRTMKNMDALEQYFQEMLSTGKMAEATLKENEE